MESMISDELDEKLNKVQMEVADKGTPVLIIFEGGSGRVISRVVNELARVLEPRGVNYYHFDVDNSPLKSSARLLQSTPAKGEISLYDRSWYALAINRFDGDKGDLDDRLKVINRMEEYLLDNGTFIIKIRLAATTEALKEHSEDYRPYTAMNGTFLSVDHIDHYKYRILMDDVVKETSTDRAPWDQVKVGPIEDTVKKTVEVLIDRFGDCLKEKWKKPGKHSIKKKYDNPRKDIVLDHEVDDWKSEMEEISDRLQSLQILLALSGRSLILCFEGRDAAGKGGCIKQVAHALNPRGYRIMRVAKPTEEDYAHSYLWRFCRNLPSAGRISIFDRTWYGRMMVEPIDGFCTEDEYERSAEEINAYESLLAASGAIVIKFWLEIDKDTQLQRFNDRQEDPLKRWKITKDDWHNRDKWDDYGKYVDAMIESTNTPWAPWVVVPANNKRYAQLTVLHTVEEALEREVGV